MHAEHPDLVEKYTRLLEAELRRSCSLGASFRRPVLVGVGAAWVSEIRWAPLDFESPPYGGLFAEPRGSRKEDGFYSIDLELSRGLDLGPTHLRLIGSVYNLLDSERPTAFCDNVSGCGASALGDPVDWQQPRVYEIGL